MSGEGVQLSVLKRPLTRSPLARKCAAGLATSPRKNGER
jgi:hypothetical protein